MRKLITLLLTAALAISLVAVAPSPAHAADPTTKLIWASETTLTGLTGTAKGAVTPAAAGAAGFVEVAYKGGWAQVAATTTNARGEFVVPLNYGRSTSGTYVFRLGTVTGGVTSYSREWTVTRGPTTSERFIADLSSEVSARIGRRPGIIDSSPHLSFVNRGTREFRATYVFTPTDPQSPPSTFELQASPGGSTAEIALPCPAVGAEMPVRLPEQASWYEGGRPTELIVAEPGSTPSPCARVQLLAAAQGRWTGQPGVATGRLWPAKAGMTGFLEVSYAGRWVRIASAKTNAAGEFTVPVSYGAGTPNVSQFRLGGIVDGQLVAGWPWELSTFRTVTATLMSAPSRLPAGRVAEAWGRISRPMPGGGPVLEVWIGRWVAFTSALMRTATDWSQVLAYGENRRGAFTFRLAYYYYGAAAYTRAWTLTRY